MRRIAAFDPLQTSPCAARRLRIGLGPGIGRSECKHARANLSIGDERLSASPRIRSVWPRGADREVEERGMSLCYCRQCLLTLLNQTQEVG